MLSVVSTVVNYVRSYTAQTY